MDKNVSGIEPFFDSQNPFHNMKHENNDKTVMRESTQEVLFYISIICYILTFIAIIFNLAFLITVRKDPSLRTASLKLLTTLGVSDLVQGCVSLPLTGTYLLKLSYGYLDYLLRDVSQIVVHSITLLIILNIFNITLFQYLSMVKPLKYRSDSSVNRYIMAAVVITLFNLIMAILCKVVLKAFDTYTKVIAILVIVILVVMIALYIHMPYVIRKSRLSVRSRGVSRQLKRQFSDRKTKIKLMKVSFVILVTLIIVYIPAMIVSYFLNFPKASSSMYIGIALNILAEANCIFDCLVYYLMRAKIRKAICNVFCNTRWSTNRNIDQNITRNDTNRQCDIRKLRLIMKRSDLKNIYSAKNNDGFSPA